MLLVCDIGNTMIHFGRFQGRRLVKKVLYPHDLKERASFLRKFCRGMSIDEGILCSVVPQATRILKSEIEKKLKIKVRIVGKDIQVLLKNRYRNQRRLGQDRLVNAYAGVMLYGCPLIVISCGTAITFDVVSKKKEYLGGMILPGLELGLQSLASRTALLPKLRLEKPKEFIGRGTKNCILSGIVNGSACMIDGLVSRLRSQIGSDAKVIISGGNARFLARYCRTKLIVEPDLSLKGLQLMGEEELAI